MFADTKRKKVNQNNKNIIKNKTAANNGIKSLYKKHTTK